ILVLLNQRRTRLNSTMQSSSYKISSQFYMDNDSGFKTILWYAMKGLSFACIGVILYNVFLSKGL
ncbi:MAG: hypothetical protein DRN37_07600, partial [Thermoplasmata archaeon]